MGDLPAIYSPQAAEKRWYDYWMRHRLFCSVPDGREPYAIVIPPPNVTGVLHMGHMLNCTIQDVLVRRARMTGKNACWVPGTDHASIATEAKVTAKLAAEGINKNNISRPEFLQHAWEWTRTHGGIIIEQLKRLGASCDWERINFTMNPDYSRSVTRVFVDLYNRGKIYRGVRMVNWDPKAQTALSDEEVIHKEQQGKLYFLRYTIAGKGNACAIVATTRPETIMGDTAVAINPRNPKTAHLKGQRLIVPLINREVPVIEDEYVDMEFGTGCLKVTPAHDINDYMLGQKHNLPIIDIFDSNGTLNANAQLYIGQDRFDVRRQIEQDLDAAGFLEKTEPYVNKVGCSERTNVPIEPKLSMQWFVRTKDLAQPALAAVMEGRVQIYPAKFKNTYRHWMENIKDWCISRQLWWGHRIPAWYICPDGAGGGADFVAAQTAEEALELARKKTGRHLQMQDLRQDEDCLDTWFSSWLWPLSVFDPDLAGSPNANPNNDFRYYYPTADLVTGPDILFFWVARMIMAGYEWGGGCPFRNVYLTGIVRDKYGRKMSKSLGNSPDPIALIDQYGADGVRLGLLLTLPAGNDLPFNEGLCEQGRNFCNKIWNAFRLVKSWEAHPAAPQPDYAAAAVEWFGALLNASAAKINSDFEKYRLSEALMELYKLYWDEFSGWYLEIVKPLRGQPIDPATCNATLQFFDVLLRLLHPFMPFITEELWQNLAPRTEGESIMYAPLPVPQASSPSRDAAADFDFAKQIVTNIRSIRQGKNIPLQTPLQLFCKGALSAPVAAIVKRLAGISGIEAADGVRAGAAAFLAGTTEFYLPLGHLADAAQERRKLEADLAHYVKFLAAVEAKLANPRFTASAPPAVVSLERKKQSDVQSKIKAIEEQIAAMQD